MAIVLAVLAILIMAACGGASEPRPTAPETEEPTRSPKPTEMPPEPTPEPTPGPFLSLSERLDLLEDATFTESIRAMCRQTRPAHLATLTGPSWPPDKAPTYGTAQMVVAEVIGPDGPLPDLPPLPPDSLWDKYGQTFRGDVALSSPADIQLLACIAIRTGAGASYTGTYGTKTVYHTDDVVWMVDARSGEPVGDPWVLGDREDDEFPQRLSSSYGLDDVEWLSAGDIAPSVVSFLGGVRPNLGVFEADDHGSDLLLPAGYDLEASTNVVRLVVFEDDRVAFVDVFCAPKGTLSGKRLRVDTDVPVKLGHFKAASAEVALEGEFRSAFARADVGDEATGTIQALRTAATNCGVPKSAMWTATWYFQLAAQREGDDYRLEETP